MSRISNYRAADLLCSAFEGGSNYWYMIESYKKPASEDNPFIEGKPWGDEYTPAYISIPFSEDGAVLMCDAEDEDTHFQLDKESIVRGKKLMEEDEQYSHFFADVLNEEDDAETGDVFLQLCVFGEVIYG